MIVKFDAIVLHVRRIGESGRIVTLYTRERGKLGVVARGAARPKSRLAPLLQPMACIQAVVYMREGRELQNLSEAETLRRFPGLASSLERMTTGLAMVEIVNAVSIDDDPNTELFDLLVEALRRTGDAQDPLGVHIWFLARLASALGYALQTDVCSVCQEEITLDDSGVRFCVGAGAPLCAEHQRIAPWTLIARGSYEVLRAVCDGPTQDNWNGVLSPVDFAQLHDLLHGFLRHHVEGMRRLRVGSVSMKLQSNAPPDPSG